METESKEQRTAEQIRRPRSVGNLEDMVVTSAGGAQAGDSHIFMQEMDLSDDDEDGDEDEDEEEEEDEEVESNLKRRQMPSPGGELRTDSKSNRKVVDRPDQRLHENMLSSPPAIAPGLDSPGHSLNEEVLVRHMSIRGRDRTLKESSRKENSTCTSSKESPFSGRLMHNPSRSIESLSIPHSTPSIARKSTAQVSLSFSQDGTASTTSSHGQKGIKGYYVGSIGCSMLSPLRILARSLDVAEHEPSAEANIGSAMFDYYLKRLSCACETPSLEISNVRSQISPRVMRIPVHELKKYRFLEGKSPLNDENFWKDGMMSILMEKTWCPTHAHWQGFKPHSTPLAVVGIGSVNQIVEDVSQLTALQLEEEAARVSNLKKSENFFSSLDSDSQFGVQTALLRMKQVHGDSTALVYACFFFGMPTKPRINRGHYQLEDADSVIVAIRRHNDAPLDDSTSVWVRSLPLHEAIHALGGGILTAIERWMLRTSPGSINLSTPHDKGERVLNGSQSSTMAFHLNAKQVQARRRWRLRKVWGDYCLMLGALEDAERHYSTAIDSSRGDGSRSDLLWLAGSLEGMAAAKAAMMEDDDGDECVDRSLWQIVWDCLHEASNIYRLESLPIFEASVRVKLAKWAALIMPSGGATGGKGMYWQAAHQNLREAISLGSEFDSESDRCSLLLDVSVAMEALGCFRKSSLSLLQAASLIPSPWEDDVWEDDLNNFIGVCGKSKKDELMQMEMRVLCLSGQNYGLLDYSTRGIEARQMTLSGWPMLKQIVALRIIAHAVSSGHYGIAWSVSCDILADGALKLPRDVQEWIGSILSYIVYLVPFGSVLRTAVKFPIVASVVPLSNPRIVVAKRLNKARSPFIVGVRSRSAPVPTENERRVFWSIGQVESIVLQIEQPYFFPIEISWAEAIIQTPCMGQDGNIDCPRTYFDERSWLPGSTRVIHLSCLATVSGITAQLRGVKLGIGKAEVPVVQTESTNADIRVVDIPAISIRLNSAFQEAGKKYRIFTCFEHGSRRKSSANMRNEIEVLNISSSNVQAIEVDVISPQLGASHEVAGSIAAKIESTFSSRMPLGEHESVKIEFEEICLPDKLMGEEIKFKLGFRYRSGDQGSEGAESVQGLWAQEILHITCDEMSSFKFGTVSTLDLHEKHCLSTLLDGTMIVCVPLHNCYPNTSITVRSQSSNSPHFRILSGSETIIVPPNSSVEILCGVSTEALDRSNEDMDYYMRLLAASVLVVEVPNIATEEKFYVMSDMNGWDALVAKMNSTANSSLTSLSSLYFRPSCLIADFSSLKGKAKLYEGHVIEHRITNIAGCEINVDCDIYCTKEILGEEGNLAPLEKSNLVWSGNSQQRGLLVKPNDKRSFRTCILFTVSGKYVFRLKVKSSHNSCMRFSKTKYCVDVTQ